MGEWWTYSLDDFVMFSPRTWYGLLASHNRAWWPLQPATVLLGAGLAWALYRRIGAALHLALLATGAGLLFVAAAFHAGPHAAINLAAPYFAGVFAAQGLALLAAAWVLPARSGGAARVGLGLLSGATLVYPLLAPLSGRPLVQAEVFALAPDPTMLAALAVSVLLVCGGHGVRRARLAGAVLSLVPLAWCALAGATAWVLGAPDWWLMPSAAALAAAALAWQWLGAGGPPRGGAGR